MTAVSPAEASRRLERLAGALESPRTLENIAQTFAGDVLKKARSRAARHPTPQARMVSTAAYAKQGVVRVDARQGVRGRGGEAAAGEIARGSEFGTTGRYPQFRAPHTNKGYWLYPAARDADDDRPLLVKVDRGLQGLLDGVAEFGYDLQALESLLGRAIKVA